jgi:hypothetical protein
MIRILFSFFAALLLFSDLSAQTGADFYRSPENPYYWKNRKPYSDYWQQDVYYNIKATMYEKTDVLDGYEELTYFNNSPDELSFVFFHLYENAYQPGSYYDNLSKGNNNTPFYGRYESNKLGITIESITIDDKELQTEFDNTLMKVYLPVPLKSGESVTFKIKFKTYFDILATWRRMRVYNEYGFKHYNGAQWYPRINVYDMKFGWTTDQHLGHEFYGDFGVYDVELNFANNFIVDATGLLQNEDDVLPSSLKSKLNIKNFKDKPLYEKPSVIIPYDSTIRKTWKYHADNVHDFAFVADPTFRIGEAFCTPKGYEGKPIKCIALAMEPDASKWQNAADFTAKIIKMYSETFGMYCYPKIIVADAESGMEYPMLTMDSELDPDYKYLLAHEVGHNWFYGMVGNNETYRAALDEGFTVFISSWLIDSVSKSEAIESTDPSLYVQRYTKKYSPVETYAYSSYYENAMKTDGVQLNTHSDAFITEQAYGSEYRQVYSKTSTMLYNLRYVLGDSLFFAAMKNYFEQWKFAHPYFEDLRSSFIRSTKVDLNWFFDEWLETNKTIDYSIKSIRTGDSLNQYIITFKRKGKMQMPIDFSVITKSDSVYNYYIPNTWFIKKTDATVLPKWFGWNNLNKTYQATVTIPGRISNVVIDPSNALADINMFDNSYKYPIRLSFDSKIYNRPDRTQYELLAGPDIWWNSYDGLKFGLDLNGSYYNYKNKFDLKVWMNSGILQDRHYSEPHFNSFDAVSYMLTYSNPITKFSRNSAINIAARDLDGINSYTIEIEKKNNRLNNRFYIHFNSEFIKDSTDLKYLLYPAEWGISIEKDKVRYNNSITLGFENNYKNKLGTGTNYVKLRSSAFNSFYDFATFSFSNINKRAVKKLALKTRVFIQFAMGTSIANESSLFLAGANPEELINNKYTRAAGLVDRTWLGYGSETNHFQEGGGLNLRGYAGYLVAEQGNEGGLAFVYKGHSGIALNAELEFNKYIYNRQNKFTEYVDIRSYLFGDAGIISSSVIYEDLAFAAFRADAGLGVSLTIKKWGPLEKLKPLTFRFDMPLFLNRPPYLENKYFKFRWVVGINRAF